MIPPEIVTTTLRSGTVLAIPVEATWGEVFIAKVFLVLLAIGVIELMYEMIYEPWIRTRDN